MNRRYNMIIYNNDKRPCVLKGTFYLGGKLMARAEDIYSHKALVITYEKWKCGDFSFNKDLGVESTNSAYNVGVDLTLEEPTHLALVTQNVEELGERQSAVTFLPSNKEVRIRATTPKGKELFFNREDTEDFCNKYKLDLNAVISVIEGTQKTHRKWGFVEVE